MKPYNFGSTLSLCVAVLYAAPTLAFMPPERAPLPNLDHRIDQAQAGNAPSAAQRNAAEQLRSRLATARVDFDPVTGSPRLVSAAEGFLSGPNGQGKGIAAAVAASFSADDPYRATKAFLREHQALFGHGPEALDQARVKREFTTPHNGLRTAAWQQQVDGVPVFEALLISHTTRNGELVSLSSQFVPDPVTAADRGAINRAALLSAPEISARQAVAIAGRNVGEEISDAGIEPIETNAQVNEPASPEKRQEFTSAAFKGTASASLVWLPLNSDRLDLCWDVLLLSRTRDEMFRVLVDAQTGEIMVRRCLTDYLTDATYRVYTSDSPTPFSPGHPAPSTAQPSEVPRALLTFSALDTNASPSGWINDADNETRGNNVDAHTDRNADNQPDLPRPQGLPARVFDFPLDLAQDPTSYSSAAVVQLFYWNNFIHDKLYDLGFTEAAGNFQSDNFGRGGLGNDAVQADAQDGGGYDNANFSTPPDGHAGRMQMYIFRSPTPDRDGDLDAEVILHEYTHGLSNRRVGGGVGISALQSAGMGEGWSDFYALALLSEPDDDVNAAYASGAYVSYLLGGLAQNYYYGIRRYPYSTDTSKNPLTFKDIDPSQASTHPGVPRSPIIGNSASEVHNMGEVWCVTLWEARANLINKYGWAVGNDLILQLVTDGMNLSPANPNFLQARDAILLADQVNTGGANRAELWAAFAKRGMGKSATSPSSSTSHGVHEAFDLPDPLAILPSTVSAGGPPGGPFTPNPGSFVLTNSGATTLEWSLGNTSLWVNVSPVGGALAAATGTNISATITPAAEGFAPGVYRAGLWVTNKTTGIVQPASFVLAVIGRHMFDDFEPGIDLSQWSGFGGAVGGTVLATNYGGSVSGVNSLWLGNDGSRYATTLPIDTTSGGFIRFSLRFGNGLSGTWELVDLPEEGVVLECSTNNGATYNVLGTYDTAAYYDWTEVSLAIPPIARGPAALFRWRQLSNTGPGLDQWALDDVFIVAEDLAPVIAVQPQNQTVPTGDPAILTVTAFGTEPLSYQWLRNGTNLSGATSSALTWANAQVADAGIYSVWVSNRVGTASSSNATLSVYVPVCAPPPPGLVSWWTAEGDATDQVGVNHATLQGTAGFAPGRVGDAFSFDGASGYASIPASPSLDVGLGAGFTIECWIKPADVASFHPLVEWNNGSTYGTHFWIFGNPQSIYLSIRDTTGANHNLNGPANILNNTRFQHVAATYDKASGVATLYLNGAAVATANFGSVTPQTSYNLFFGRRPAGTQASFYGGLMDEVSLYARALSAAEIQGIYVAASAGKCGSEVPPTILRQPQGEVVHSGANVSFDVLAAGTSPLSYQWRQNGNPLAGATDSVLSIANVQLTNAGTYTVTVTNAYGSVDSSEALLFVNESGCVAAPASLVSWWAGERDTSDAVGTNSGFPQGGLTYALGETGHAFALDGVSGYVRIPSSPSLNVGTGAGFTIESWIKPADVSSPHPLVEWNSGSGYATHFWIYGNPQSFYLSILDTSGVSHNLSAPANLLNTNSFQHVAATYDKASGVATLYYNGAPVASAVFGSITPRTGYDLYLGRRPAGAQSSYYQGLMDEASLYARALTANEIQAIYEAASEGKCPQPVPPAILAQPQSQLAGVGMRVDLSVSASGASPLNYQWSLDGAPLGGATTSTLSISNVQPANAGTYSVAITNTYGSIVSSNAVLTVVVENCTPAPTNIVAWWQAQGDAADTVGSNPGSSQGGLSYGNGKAGQAFSFDGYSGYVSVPASSTLNVGLGSGFTIECWIKPSDITSAHPLVEWNSGSTFGTHFWIFGNPESIYMSVKDTSGFSHNLNAPANILTTTNFQHVAATYDKASGMARLYRNGVEVANANFGNVTPQTSYNLFLGRRPAGTQSSYYQGLMDEVSVYSRALSTAELQAIYNAGSAGKCGLAPVTYTPPASQIVECSSNATFAVTVIGLPPLAYQWYFESSPLPGATTAALNLGSVGFGQAGNYSVVITNTYGSVTSGPALLTVVDTVAPTISTCAGNRTVAASTECSAVLPDLTGEVVASDASGPVAVTQNPPAGTLLPLGSTNVTFAVQDFSGNAASCFSSLTVADQTPPTILTCISNLTLSVETNCLALLPDLTGTNYITAYDDCSSMTVTQMPPASTPMPVGTNVALLLVFDGASNLTSRSVAVIVPSEASIVVQPLDLKAVATSNATFVVTACGAAPLAYQWQHASTNLANATSAVLTLSSVKPSDAGDYRVIVTNAFNSVTSEVATLTVLQPPVFTRQPGSLAAVPGGTATLVGSVQGRTPLVWQWHRNSLALPGQTRNRLAFANIQPEDFATYTLAVTNADGFAISDPALLTMAVSPVLKPLGLNATTFSLTIPTELGPIYQVDYKDSVEAPVWNQLTTVTGTGLPVLITDNGLTNTQRFYRVQVR